MQKAHDREVVGFRYFGREVSPKVSASGWPLPCRAVALDLNYAGWMLRKACSDAIIYCVYDQWHKFSIDIKI